MKGVLSLGCSKTRCSRLWCSRPTSKPLSSNQSTDSLIAQEEQREAASAQDSLSAEVTRLNAQAQQAGQAATQLEASRNSLQGELARLHADRAAVDQALQEAGQELQQLRALSQQREAQLQVRASSGVQACTLRHVALPCDMT